MPPGSARLYVPFSHAINWPLTKLAWQLDLVFAKLAATLNCDVAGLAKHAARQTIELLTRAWRPATPEDYALSPPSFRLPRMTHELIPRTPATSKAHALWSQQVSATVGADMAERLSLHIAHTVWYMAVRDARRPYTRPAIMGSVLRTHSRVSTPLDRTRTPTPPSSLTDGPLADARVAAQCVRINHLA